MKKQAWLIGAALFVCASGLGAENPWQAVALPQPAPERALHGIAFADARHGWIVGAQGFCAATTDGGAAWSLKETGSPATLRSVFFTEPARGWIGGDGDVAGPSRGGIIHIVFTRPAHAGTLLRTRDGGATWTNIWLPTNFEIPCLASTDKRLVVGTSAGSDHLDGDLIVYELGKTRLFCSGYRSIFAVSPAGPEQWIAVGAPVSVGFTPAPPSPLYKERNARILRSRDDGKTWEPARGSEKRVNAGRCLRGLAVKAGKLALAVGDGGEILRSEDGGDAWESVTSGTESGLTSVAWGDGPMVVAVGAKGTVLVSRDDGKTWAASTVPASPDLRALTCAGGQFWAAGGNGVLLRARVADLAGDAAK